MLSKPLLRMPKLQPGGQVWPRPGGRKFYMGLHRENLPNLPVPSHKAEAYQILHVALSSRPLPKVPKLQPLGQIWPNPRDLKFYMGKL